MVPLPWRQINVFTSVSPYLSFTSDELIRTRERKGDLSGYGFTTTDLGSAKHLPTTVTALYYFGISSSVVRPYIGLGVNYTTFFSESLGNQWLLNASFWHIDTHTGAAASPQPRGFLLSRHSLYAESKAPQASPLFAALLWLLGPRGANPVSIHRQHAGGYDTRRLYGIFSRSARS